MKKHECCRNCQHSVLYTGMSGDGTWSCQVLSEMDHPSIICFPFFMGGSKKCAYYQRQESEPFKYPQEYYNKGEIQK